MANKVMVYTDASYKDGKCGYAVMYSIPKPVFIYGNCSATNSIEAELIAVIRAMEYIIQYLGQLDNTEYEMRVDQQSIVDFITRKLYKKWNKCGWRDVNGNYRRRNIELWHKLMCLYELFPKGFIKFKKVKSKRDCKNRIVDRIAGFIIKREDNEKLKTFIVHQGNCKSIITGKVKPSIILIDEYVPSESVDEIEVRYKNNKNNKSDFINWLDSVSSNIVLLPVDNILVTEQEHLQCKEITFNGILETIHKENKITIPIAVKKLDETNKYSLVAGVKRLFSAKILGIKTIPSIITETSHKEFIEKYNTR